MKKKFNGCNGNMGINYFIYCVFAAAMPVCGQGDISLMGKVKNLPIWAFHATDDPIVPMYGQKDQYKYNNQNAINWLFSQKK